MTTTRTSRRKKRPRKRPTRAERARRKRTAQADSQVTETTGELVDCESQAPAQDVGSQVPGTTDTQQHGEMTGSQPASQIRIAGKLSERVRQGLEIINQDSVACVIASMAADATSAESAKERSAAANAFSRLAKLCLEQANPQPKVAVQVNNVGSGSVNAAGETLSETIARMRREKSI